MYHFFISDKNNQARRQNVMREASRLAITPNFFDAIMGRHLSKEELNQLVIPDTFLTVGEIGCAASHLEVLKTFLKSEQDYVFIFEDDIVFSEQFTLEIMQEIGEFIVREGPRALVLQNSIFKKKNIYKLRNDINIFSAHNLFCMHGYVVNRQAAENIIKIQSPIKFEIDAFKFYYWLDACDLYCLDTTLVDVEPEVSELSDINYGEARNYNDERVRKKNKAFNILYRELTFLQKLRVQMKRFQKALHKPFEKL